MLVADINSGTEIVFTDLPMSINSDLPVTGSIFIGSSNAMSIIGCCPFSTYVILNI